MGCVIVIRTPCIACSYLPLLLTIAQHTLNLGFLFRGQEPTTSKVVITCSPEQWNRLLTVDAVGNSLFQELVYPFKSNPNVQIQPLYERQVIVITGQNEAVKIAKECIEKGLTKDTPVDK